MGGVAAVSLAKDGSAIMNAKPERFREPIRKH